MKVIPFKIKTGRRAYRNRREVQTGETCYAVQDETTGLYFVWAYTNEAFAQRMTSRLSIGDETDRACNWRRDVQDTMVSSRDII